MAASDYTTTKYSPQTNGVIRRSKYLEDALSAMQSQGGDIKGGWGELAAKLGATYLLERGRKKNDTALSEAMAQEAKTREGRITSWLPPSTPAPSTPTPPMGSPVAPQPQSAPPPPSSLEAAMLKGGPPPQAPGKPSGGSLIDALMPGLIKQESGGRPGVLGPQTRYGQAQGMTQMLPATAKSMADKLGVPWRPELMTGKTPEAAEYQQTLGRAYLQEGLDKYGNDPEQALKYYHGGPDERLWGPKTNAYARSIMGGLQLTGGPAPGPMQVQQQFPQQGGQMPQGAPPPQMPQQQPSPQMPPQQGAAAPGSPLPGGPGGSQPWGPSQGEMDLLRQLAADPRTQDQAESLSMELRKKYAAPPKYDSITQNGVAGYWNPNNPGAGVTPFGIMPGAMNQTVTAGQLNLPGDPNAAYSVDPYGKPTSVAQAPAGYQYGPRGSMSAVQGGPQDPTSGANLIEGEAKLRREYEGAMQQYLAARTGYSKVVSAAQDGTGASDIALIFGFMKTLDPTSTVREGEFATAQNSGSVDQTLMNLYNKALKGERLQPEQRAQLAQTAASQFATYEAQAKQLNERYSGLAQSYGYDPSRITQQYEPIKPPQVSEQPGGGMGQPQGIPQGAQRGQDGNFYIEDARKPGSFPQLQKTPQGFWVYKNVNGKYVRVD